MRVYLSVDMEGIAGISHPGPTSRGDDGYPAAVELMVGEANAAIEGALEAGAAEVVVNDSHGEMYNLTPGAMHPAAKLVQGKKPYSMVESARVGSFDVALFVGYHTRAGHPRGTIAHTYSGRPTLTALNGRPVGETGINALYLGALGVPVGLVTGDDALSEEVAEWLPWAERVTVKRAVGWRAAESVHPTWARELVREGARRAVSRARGDGEPFQPLRLEPPIRVLLEFTDPGQADYAGLIPGFARAGDRGITYETDDPVECFRAFVSAIRLSGLASG